MYFTFMDGETLGVYRDGKIEKYESSYVKKHRESALRSVKSREWRRESELQFSDDPFATYMEDTAVTVEMQSVLPIGENKILYAVTLNGASAVYYKQLDDEEKTESHFLSSNQVEFGCFYTESGEILGSGFTSEYCSNIAVFSATGDYKFITDGDTLDENPSFDKDGDILFNSYAVCRDARGQFIDYMPSEIYRLKLQTMEVETLVTDGKYSYIKPVMDGKGNLYAIRKPGTASGEGNIFLDILLIPVRIVQAIVGFIAAFVLCFARKPMISGGSADGDMTRASKGDPKKIWLGNTLVNVDREMKKNRKKDGGFIPRNWVLVRLEPNEKGLYNECAEYEIAKGVGDYILAEETESEKTLVYTNGKHIFAVKDYGKDGKKDKLFDADFCLRLGKEYASHTPFEEEKTSLFNRL